MGKSLKNFVLFYLPPQDGVAHLYLGGEVDLLSVPKIRATHQDILRRCPQVHKVIIHFEAASFKLQDGQDAYSPGATFCDETCVALMVKMWKELRDRGCELILIITENVRRTFEQKSLGSIMTIVENESEIDDDE